MKYKKRRRTRTKRRYKKRVYKRTNKASRIRIRKHIQPDGWYTEKIVRNIDMLGTITDAT